MKFAGFFAASPPNRPGPADPAPDSAPGPGTPIRPPRRGVAVSAPDELGREIAALRERISTLSTRISALGAASLRISASLDLETVLNEVVESARALPEGRSGQPPDCGNPGAGMGSGAAGGWKARSLRWRRPGNSSPRIRHRRSSRTSGSALERVRDAPETTHRDRERLLACLVEEVALQVVEEDRTEVVIHWRGARTDAFSVKREKRRSVRQCDDIDAVESVRRLARFHSRITALFSVCWMLIWKAGNFDWRRSGPMGDSTAPTCPLRRRAIRAAGWLCIPLQTTETSSFVPSRTSYSSGYRTTTTDANQSRAHPCTEQNLALATPQAVPSERTDSRYLGINMRTRKRTSNTVITARDQIRITHFSSYGWWSNVGRGHKVPHMVND